MIEHHLRLMGDGNLETGTTCGTFASGVHDVSCLRYTYFEQLAWPIIILLSINIGQFVNINRLHIGQFGK